MKIADIEKETSEGDWQCDYTISSLVGFITDLENCCIDIDKPLQMNPDFQRGHVWNEKQQIKYIESLLRNGAKNARVIYLNCPSWGSIKDYSNKYNDMVCVDGLQRYTAIKRFVNNELKVLGYYFNEFEDAKIFSRKYIMKLNINNLQTKREVLKWYLEINSNGTPHTKKECDDIISKVLEQRNKLIKLGMDKYDFVSNSLSSVESLEEDKEDITKAIKTINKNIKE